ncbi:DUF3376 domain-containing protein [Smaragdicoccus niigatensis]|uniref:DUF3376 domain-containing protein n=1 Tax=Smaragdicoccus niigatensis TaxID=359359 RepID=UPI001FDF443F|nr:DUF3376 domain-containing protein [Smaragdicoccus niigatensis]
MYLDPQPPAKRDPVKAAKDIPKASTRKKDESEQKVQSGRWAHIVRTANSLRERVESADLEIGQIREHNDNVMAIRGRLEGLAAAMANSDVAIEVNIGQYVQSRIGFDAKRIGELLTSPWAYMSMPPHSASRYRALKPLRAMRVAHALKHAYDHSASTDAKATQWPVEWIGPDMVPKAFAIGDIGAAVDAARVLIAWTQKMQQIQGGHQHDLSRLKRGLYRCLTVLVEARRTMVDDSVLVLANSDIAEGIRLGLCKQTRLCMTWSLFQLLKIRVDKSDDALDAELFIELARSPGTAEAGRNHLYFPPVQSEIGPTLFLTLIWLALEGYRSALGVISQNVQPFASDARKWDESAFRQAGLPKYASLDCYALVRVFSLAGTPNTADIIQFQRITGDERPHLQDGDLSDLRNAAIASTLERWLRTNVDPNSIQRQHLQKSMQATVELKSAEWKLDGIPLARFGGFLARRWRINDWYWGRLDAAAGIVRMLPPATSESDDSEHRSVQSKLQDSIFRESKEFTTSADGKGLAAIPGWYRSAIAARLGPLALRALWPQDLPTGSLSTWAKVIGLLLARPLTVLVALVVDPLRFAAAFAISLGTTAMLSRAERPRHGQAFPPDAHYLSTFALGLMLVGAVIGSGVLISRGIGVRGRWRRLKEIVAIGLSNHPHQREPHNLWNITLDAARKPAIATCWLSIVIGCGLTPLTAVVVSVPAVRKFVSPELAIAVAACVVGLILDLNNRAQTVRRVRQPVRPAQPIQPPEKRLLMWLLLAVGGGIVTLDSILGAEHRWHWSTSLTENPSPWIAGIEAIVLTYLTVCHWADKRSIVLLMVGTTAAAVLPQVVATCIHKGVLPGVLPTVVLIIILGFSLQYVRPVTWENDQAPPKRFAVLD